mmetsp:Transcript_57599/g.137314  ORF Transcript_57599/g.137314 Transcript_57599/m.137314 type:complete len:259 (+) Transcript_57599:37-813(+)
MKKMLHAFGSASPEEKSAEEDMNEDSLSRRATASGSQGGRVSDLADDITAIARPNSMAACDRPRNLTATRSFNPATMALPTVSLPFLAPPRSPRSQAAIDKCMAAIAECRAVLAESNQDESSDAWHDDDLIDKIALRRVGAVYRRGAPSSTSHFRPRRWQGGSPTRRVTARPPSWRRCQSPPRNRATRSRPAAAALRQQGSREPLPRAPPPPRAPRRWWRKELRGKTRCGRSPPKASRASSARKRSSALFGRNPLTRC